MSALRWLGSPRSAGGVLLLGAAFLLTGPACNKKPASSSPSLPAKQGQPATLKPDAELLVGKWASASRSGSGVEFTADGRVILSDAGRVREGRYRWGRGRAVEILATDGEFLIRWQIDALGANELVATANAKQTTFRRAR